MPQLSRKYFLAMKPRTAASFCGNSCEQFVSLTGGESWSRSSACAATCAAPACSRAIAARFSRRIPSAGLRLTSRSWLKAPSWCALFAPGACRARCHDEGLRPRFFSWLIPPWRGCRASLAGSSTWYFVRRSFASSPHHGRRFRTFPIRGRIRTLSHHLHLRHVGGAQGGLPQCPEHHAHDFLHTERLDQLMAKRTSPTVFSLSSVQFRCFVDCASHLRYARNCLLTLSHGSQQACRRNPAGLSATIF